MPAAVRGKFFWAFYSHVYDRLWDNELLALAGWGVIALLPRCSRILEIGAGTGIVTQHLVRSGHSVIASEPDPYMARRLARRLPATVLIPHSLQRVAFYNVDILIAVNVVHLLPGPIAAVRRMQSRCAPGGQVLIVSPQPHAGLRTVARARLRAGAGIWQVLYFIALHLVLGPLAKICGVPAGKGLGWVDDDQIRRFEIAWPPIAESLTEVYRIMLVPAGADLSGGTRPS